MGLEIHFTYGGDTNDLYDRLRSLDFQNLRAKRVRKQLDFVKPAVTSRGKMNSHTVDYLVLWEDSAPEIRGIGEIAPLPGLSRETVSEKESSLDILIRDIEGYEDHLTRGDLPSSVLFGLETALLDLHSYGDKILFPSKFTEGKEAIPINGLIWMADAQDIAEQINEKLRQGYRVIKMKIGANPDTEINLIRQMRSHFSSAELEIRLDANGAFRSATALQVLEALEPFGIHSVEQPIKPGCYDEMSELCRESPIPIALDEELIGITDVDERMEMLETIMPSYIILKPTLCGGLQGASEYINLCDELGIGWWATSALESNIGLNAIAQWVYTLQNPMPQGLGTGLLYKDNFLSPLTLKNDLMYYDPNSSWDNRLSVL
jgi:o-succinylbenzoate synthase